MLILGSGEMLSSRVTCDLEMFGFDMSDVGFLLAKIFTYYLPMFFLPEQVDSCLIAFP